MFKIPTLIIILLFPLFSFARTFRVGVLDSGYYPALATFKHCDPSLDKDFTGEGMNDTYNHGQNINHIIANGNENIDYCIVNIKAFSGKKNLPNDVYEKAVIYLSSLNLDVVNLSYQAMSFSMVETIAIKKLIEKNTIIIASAGNWNINLDNGCNVYPACVDTAIIIVGSTDYANIKSKFSNYGKAVRIWTIGENVTAGGLTESGTSQSAAVYTNHVIKLLGKRIR